MQKIILFSYDFPPSMGGVARLTWQVAKGLKTHYDAVTVLTRTKEGTMQPQESIEVEMKYLPQKRFACEKAAFNFFKEIPDKENYIVICGLWHPEAAIALFAGMPTVFTLAHGGELIRKGSFLKRNLWFQLYGKRVLENCTKVIANSSFTKRAVLKVAPKANVTALPLAVDNTTFYPLSEQQEFKSSKNNSKLTIVTVSRIQPHKGHTFVLEAISKLSNTLQSQISWQIAGTGSFKENLEALVSKSDTLCEINFRGFIPEESLNEFYNAGDVFILCSQDDEASNNVEGFGLVFLEAQAAGVPVVGSDSGGIPDAIDINNGGWIVAQDEPLSLTKLIEQFLADKKILKQQGNLARTRVLKDCTWKDYVSDFIKIMSNNG